MERREMKRMLMAFGKAQEQLKKEERKIKEMYAQYDAILTASPPQKEGKGANVNSDSVAAKACMREAVREEINQSLQRISDKMVETEKLRRLMLQVLSGEERAVIEARYCKRLRWEYIAGKVRYSRRACFILHDRAIKKLCENWEKSA